MGEAGDTFRTETALLKAVGEEHQSDALLQTAQAMEIRLHTDEEASPIRPNETDSRAVRTTVDGKEMMVYPTLYR